MSLFEKGRAKTGGRLAGVRNKLSKACLESALKAYEEHGDAAWKILAVESPRDFLKCIIGLMPQELEISDTRLSQLSDEELEVFIAYAKRLAPTDIRDAASRESPTIN
jgi:hypothetical protein